MTQEGPLLDEFEEEEWWDVCKAIKPQLTREEFSGLWEEFVRLKQQYQSKVLFN